jgi:hypothetical protein
MRRWKPELEHPRFAVFPVEKPHNGTRLRLEAVARVLRQLLFVIWMLLGLVFSVLCYAEMLGVVQFD